MPSDAEEALNFARQWLKAGNELFCGSCRKSIRDFRYDNVYGLICVPCSGAIQIEAAQTSAA